MSTASVFGVNTFDTDDDEDEQITELDDQLLPPTLRPRRQREELDSHRQFYVDISRVKSNIQDGLNILAMDENGAPTMETRNIIYQDLLGYLYKYLRHPTYAAGPSEGSCDYLEQIIDLKILVLRAAAILFRTICYPIISLELMLNMHWCNLRTCILACIRDPSYLQWLQGFKYLCRSASTYNKNILGKADLQLALSALKDRMMTNNVGEFLARGPKWYNSMANALTAEAFRLERCFFTDI